MAGRRERERDGRLDWFLVCMIILEETVTSGLDWDPREFFSWTSCIVLSQNPLRNRVENSRLTF